MSIFGSVLLTSTMLSIVRVPRARSVGDLVDLAGMSAGSDPVTEEWSQTPSSSSYDTKSEVCLATEYTVNDLAKSYSQEQGLHAPSTILSQCCSNPVLPVLSGTTVWL